MDLAEFRKQLRGCYKESEVVVSLRVGGKTLRNIPVSHIIETNATPDGYSAERQVQIVVDFTK